MMNRIPVIIFFILFQTFSLFSSVKCYGQVLSSAGLNNKLLPDDKVTALEEIYLHTDRDKYIAGEDVWFSTYNLNPETGKLTGSSVLVYVELLNPWNEPVIQSRFLLSKGKGEGNLALPDSISSGTYTVRAYTNWMKNFLPDYCYLQDIEIYNPFKSPDFFSKTRSSNSPAIQLTNLPVTDSTFLNIKADTVYNRRERVFLKIVSGNNESDKSGFSDISVSVTPARVASGSPWKNDYPEILSGQQKFHFESDGHYLSGNVKYREGNTRDSSKFLYMSIQGKVAEFKYAEIDTNGRFTFSLPIDNKFRTLILQPERAGSNMILEIEPSFSRVIKESTVHKENITDHHLDFFSGLSFNYQATKIYGTRSKDESETKYEDMTRKRRFYGIPEMEVLLDDYIKLPTIQEVFFELVPGIIIRPDKTGYEIKITNPLTGKLHNEPPLVMIDGVIINDLNVLVDLDPEIVEKIEVVKTPYLIGDLILHGIVNVITRSGDFSDITMPDYAVILPYRVAEKPSAFLSPDYSDAQKLLSRKPDLRNTIYWNPSVLTDSNGEAEIEFWTSDNPGLYTINIQGISGEGKKISLYETFRVK
jgi:hypothetical protein